MVKYYYWMARRMGQKIGADVNGIQGTGDEEHKLWNLFWHLAASWLQDGPSRPRQAMAYIPIPPKNRHLIFSLPPEENDAMEIPSNLIPTPPERATI